MKNKKNSPVILTFVAKTSDIRNLSERKCLAVRQSQTTEPDRPDVKASEVATLQKLAWGNGY